MTAFKSGSSESSADDATDVSDDVADGDYTSVSGSLTQTGTATDDEKQTDKGANGRAFD